MKSRCFDFTLKFHHLTSVLKESWYYALPSLHSDDSAEIEADDDFTCDVFQVLALTPGLRQYIQRSAYMTEDAACLDQVGLQIRPTTQKETKQKLN